MLFQSPASTTAITALIAAAGVVVGAVVTAAAAAFSAQQKIREVELLYQQKLRDNYLSNARQFLEEVYVPIGIALGSLGDAYDAARQAIDFGASRIDPAAQDAFENACGRYLQIIDDLFARGADAFLTTAIELRLRSLNSFLRASRTATQPIIKMVLQVRTGMFPVAPRFSSSITKEIRGRFAAELYGLTSSFSIPWFGISYSAEELIAAPLTSRQFEKRIVVDIADIKLLIKEVTLGGHAGT